MSAGATGEQAKPGTQAAMHVLAKQTLPVAQVSPSASWDVGTHDVAPVVASQAVKYTVQAFAPVAGTQDSLGMQTGAEELEPQAEATATKQHIRIGMNVRRMYPLPGS